MYTPEEQIINLNITRSLEQLLRTIVRPYERSPTTNPNASSDSHVLELATTLQNILNNQNHLPISTRLETTLQAMLCGQEYERKQAVFGMRQQITFIKAHQHKHYQWQQMMIALRTRCEVLGYPELFTTQYNVRKHPLMPFLLLQLVSGGLRPDQEVVGRTAQGATVPYDWNITYKYPWVHNLIAGIKTKYFQHFGVLPLGFVEDDHYNDKCCVIFSCNTLIHDFIPSITMEDLKFVSENTCFRRLLKGAELDLNKETISNRRHSDSEGYQDSASQPPSKSRWRCLPW